MVTRQGSTHDVDVDVRTTARQGIHRSAGMLCGHARSPTRQAAQTDKQTDRQINRQIDRQAADRQTEPANAWAR